MYMTTLAGPYNEFIGKYVKANNIDLYKIPPCRKIVQAEFFIVIINVYLDLK